MAPRTCCCCGNKLKNEEKAICTVCMLELPRTGLHMGFGGRLHEVLSNAVVPQGLASAWFHYDPASRFADLIRKAKYADRPQLAFQMGRAYARELMNDVPERLEATDILLPVPMYKFKQIKRGFNQSEEIAKGISCETGIPVGDNLTARKRHSTQTRRSLEARRSNVSGIFECNYPEELEGLDIVLVDDVVTSGSTVTECALAIGRSGAIPDSIGVLALGLAAGA